MSVFLSAKAPTEAMAYTWRPSLTGGDSVAAATIVVSSGTLTIEATEVLGDNVTFFVSGGVAGQTVTLTATAETDASETLVETIYLPIVATPSQIADTAQSYVNFALRKATGIGETPDGDELDDALERLNALIARWRAGGADIGAPYPLLSSSIIYCPDWAVSALRYNLMLECADLYGFEVTPMEYDMARRGLQLVKHRNMPEERKAEYS